MNLNKQRKVVVTGVSVCAPNGIGYADFERNTLAGVSGCDYINNFSIPQQFSRIAGIIKDFFPETQFSYASLSSNTESLLQDRQIRIAKFCIQEALRQASLEKSNEVVLDNVDLFLATAIGTMISMEYGFIAKKNYHKNVTKEKISHVYSFRYLTQELMREFKFGGRDVVIPTGCVGGCDAVTYAVNEIRQGRAKCVITGAVEAPLTPLVINAFSQINAMSTRDCSPQHASCPFDAQRDGFVIGEGGGILILESEEHALQRGAEILAEIKGFGSTNNCFHMTDILETGEHIEQSCRLAIADAGLEPVMIDYVNAHGSSTRQNDVAESRAFNKIFGDHTTTLPVTALKSQNGHALAAASAIEMVSVVQTIYSQKIPPTINLNTPDPLCALNVITSKHRDSTVNNRITNVLKVSSGFSGIHTAVVIGKWEK